MTRRCIDCGHYIPGGVERNCEKGRFKGTVCALKEACEDFGEKQEKEDLSAYPKIDLRPKIRQRRFKTDKR